MAYLTLLFLTLALLPDNPQGCALWSPAVGNLEQFLAEHLHEQYPDPRVFVTLRLVNYSLLQQKYVTSLKKNVLHNAASLSSGEFSFYVLALIASCENTLNVKVNESDTTPGTDLGKLLSEKFGQEMKSIDAKTMQILEAGNSGEITVNYTVIISLPPCTTSCSHSLCLTVPGGTRLLQLMKLAEEKDPTFFTFTQIRTSLGPFITSIGGVDGSEKKRTYWQFLNGTVPIPVGVAEYKASNGENIIARLSKY
ncbi:uncharacterized protein LOC119975256 isoform X2 [Scyliorhinus canicula]|uniref:uncharacterized protein LOC119975256 isoform X2 n=1 Tax=Scyliorhinus canicula TaxID=7830 RepID=UPI0018F2B626|nr:uncharacterized protein LOC119975256 isoform X2 [Scyliorhinus canicula]